MNDLLSWRLAAQLLQLPEGSRSGEGVGAGPPRTAEQLVAWLGGVQAQDCGGAKWSIGLRLEEADKPEIERAIAERRIIRTWAFRGTLHLLAAADVYWLLPLLAPVVIAANQRRYRELELDESTFAKGGRLIRQALEDGQPRTRGEICAVMEKNGVSTTGQRAPYLLQRAALEGAICLGPSRGREATYLPLSSPAESIALKDRDSAFTALAERYFTSHGPATRQDFSWWSGLPASVARKALQNAGSLRSMKLGGTELWAGGNRLTQPLPAPYLAHLLPPFDEYLLGYKERSAVLDPDFGKRVNAGGGMLKPVIILNGKVVGIWKQRGKKDRVQISTEPFRDLSKDERQAVEWAARRYSRYLKSAVELR